MSRLPTSHQSHEHILFVLTNEDLKKLFDAFNQFEPNTKIHIECADKNERHLDDFKKVERIANAPTNPITQIRFSTASEDGSASGSLALSENGGSNCWITIDGGEAKVETLTQTVSPTRLGNRENWYCSEKGSSRMIVRL